MRSNFNTIKSFFSSAKRTALAKGEDGTRSPNRPYSAIRASGRVRSAALRQSSARSAAFTLVEVLVSVSIFAIVMLIATGSVFSIVDANKKTHAIKSVMTNLNFALESMAREMRLGSGYVCTPSDSGTNNCSTGGTILTFKANRDVDGDGSYVAGDANDKIEYSLVTNGGVKRIQKRIYGTLPSSLFITAKEINIKSMTFYVVGTGTADNKQPKIVLTIQGSAGTSTALSNFNIETTVSQRAIDS